MHKRKPNKLLERRIRGIIIGESHYDKSKGETVSKVTRLDVLDHIGEPVEVYLVPDLEKGEVLLDPRGKGSLQRYVE